MQISPTDLDGMYRKVYYSILNSLGQRVQYINIEFLLHSLKMPWCAPALCYLPRHTTACGMYKGRKFITDQNTVDNLISLFRSFKQHCILNKMLKKYLSYILVPPFSILPIRRFSTFVSLLNS